MGFMVPVSSGFAIRAEGETVEEAIARRERADRIYANEDSLVYEAQARAITGAGSE